LVGLAGLEPAASCTPCMRATNCAIARLFFAGFVLIIHDLFLI
jgi:hypothetical protein